MVKEIILDECSWVTCELCQQKVQEAVAQQPDWIVGLEITFIVLIVIVIILGVFFAFRQLRNTGEGEDGRNKL